MKFSLTSALAGGGAALTAGALLLGALVGDVAQPLDRTTDLIAGSPAVESICPSGWQDTSTSDGHIVVLSCSKDGWLVILNPDLTFGYGWLDGSKDFEFDKAKTPWPASD